ncbi:hypothetical protein HJ590_07320 [Naumannella sp. ID2617S]|nr:hypothetical protein [Naumannella sp. ID2617S]
MQSRAWLGWKRRRRAAAQRSGLAASRALVDRDFARAQETMRTRDATAAAEYRRELERIERASAAIGLRSESAAAQPTARETAEAGAG